MAENKKKHIFMIARIALVAAAIVYAVYWTCQADRWKIFLQISPWLFIVGLLAFIASQVIVGLRWWLLLRTQKVYIDLTAAIKLNMLGLFYSNFMPSSVGGDVLRAWYVTKHTDKKFVAVLSVFVDRMIGMSSIAVMAVGSWVLFMSGQTLALEFPDIAGLIGKHKTILSGLAIAMLVIVFVLLANSKSRQKLIAVWAKIMAHFKHAVKLAKDAFFMYCKNPLAILWTFLLTVALQTLVVVAMWLIAENMGMHVGIKYFFVFFPVSWVLGAVPLTPGGAVLVEGALVMLFTQFTDATLPQAFAISMCQRFIWLISSVPGIMVHLSGTHLPKDFNIDSEIQID